MKRRIFIAVILLAVLLLGGCAGMEIQSSSVTLAGIEVIEAGSRVEVIVFPTADGEDVFPTMDRIVKKKDIKPLTMKQVEKIVHDVRGVR